MNAPKDAIYEEARALFLDWYPNLIDQAACLYWTQVGMKVLEWHGYRTRLQAGSMWWPYIPYGPAWLDGMSQTHFGYEFDLDQPFSQEQLAKGQLPELHVWIGLPDENQIVDFSTGTLKKVAIEHGCPWTAPDPPPYFWGVPDQIRAIYVAKIPAIRFAWRFILEKMVDTSPLADAIIQRIDKGEEIEV